jgi:hypothetical protein
MEAWVEHVRAGLTALTDLTPRKERPTANLERELSNIIHSFIHYTAFIHHVTSLLRLISSTNSWTVSQSGQSSSTVGRRFPDGCDSLQSQEPDPDQYWYRPPSHNSL